ncbi:MAG TPA: hypothetical protein DD670_05060, partial [Planctomycetaceae bacterium]|nr:hypothetical protein [Planctomycetaceae bacterium]
ETESLEQAIDHLAKARLMRPEWAEVPMLLAMIQQQMGSPASALESYREAVRQGSRNVMGLGRFADLLIRQNQRDEATQVLALMKELNVKLSPEAEYLLAIHDFSEGKNEEGFAKLKAMADDLRARAAASEDYRDSERLSGILRQLAALAAQRKEEAEARELLDEAEAAIRRAVALQPDNGRLWMLLVALLNQTGRVARVSDVLAEAQQKLPPAQVAITLAQCYEILGRTAEAEQQYDKALTESEGDKKLPRLVATFFLRLDNSEKRAKGEAMLREMIAGTRLVEEADIAWARRRLALTLSQKGDHKSYLEAMKLVDANLADASDSVADKRIKARLLAHRPNRADRAAARAIFEELVRIPNPAPGDRYELARLLFVEKEWNEASRQMQPLLATEDIQPEWLDFHIRAQIRAGEFRDAENNLKRYERIAKDPFMVTIILARIQSGRGRHDLAIRTVKDYVDDASSAGIPRPNRALNAARALTNLAKHVTGPGRDAAIVQYLKQAEQYFREFVEKDPSQSRLLIGFLGEHGDREEALRLAEGAASADSPQPVAISAVALLSRGDPSPDEVSRVEKILDDAIKRQGEDIPLLLALAELRTIQKRYDDAEQCYRTVLAREDAKQYEIIALNNLAVFLALRGQKLDDAKQMIDRAIELAGSAATLLDSRATIHLAKGEWQKSLDDLTLALAEEPTGIRYFHQGQAYMQGGLKAEAAAAMATADDYGLKVEQLQPLERPAYRQLREALQ